MPVKKNETIITPDFLLSNKQAIKLYHNYASDFIPDKVFNIALLVADMEKGMIPDDEKWIGEIVQNISYYNAKNYFNS
jgi:glucuronate isomerase